MPKQKEPRMYIRTMRYPQRIRRMIQAFQERDGRKSFQDAANRMIEIADKALRQDAS